jgi:hypothetical protein
MRERRSVDLPDMVLLGPALAGLLVGATALVAHVAASP